MPDGLKGQWGVDDPAQAGSDEQSNRFKADFQQQLGTINEHLQYTAAHADKARHAPLAGKRDALMSAYQGALAQIDPKNAGKAQGAIDKVLGDARALSEEVAAFRQEAEKAYEEWQRRQPELEEAVRRIEELEAWEDAQAPALRSSAGALQKQADERQYAEATQALDALLPTLAPVYEEYQKQKAAKEEYEPKLAEVQPRLAQAASGAYVKLKPAQDEMASLQTQMEASAAKKDFVQALAQVGELTAKVEAYEAALKELEEQKKAYEEALAPVQPRLQSMSVAEPQYAKLQPKQQEIAAAQSAMEASAQGEDFVQALSQVQEISARLDELDAAKAEVDRQKQEYETAYEALKPRLDAAATSEPTYAKLQPQQQEIAAARGAVEAAAQASDYEQANSLLPDLGSKLDAFDQAKAEIDEQKKQYEATLADLQPRLQAAAAAAEPHYAKLQPQRDELGTAQAEAEAAAQAGDYEQANERLQGLAGKLDEFEQAKARIDEQKQQYEATLAELQPRLQAAAAATEPQYARLQPAREALAQAQAEAESLAGGGDYEQANERLEALGAKLDELEQARTEIDEQKQRYEAALAELEPRLQAVASTDPQYAKLKPQQDELAQAKSNMDGIAQGGDYEQANTMLEGLVAKVEALEEARTQIDEQKQAYESAWEALRPKYEAADKPAPTKELETSKAELAKGKADIDAAVAAGDWDAALKAVQALEPKVDAYAEALKKQEADKAEYDTLLSTLQPRLDKAATVKNDKVKAQQDELLGGQKAMEAAALIGNYTEALRIAKDLVGKADAFEKATAAADLLSLGGDATIREKEFLKTDYGGYVEGVAKIGGSVKYKPAADAVPGDVTKEEVQQSVLDFIDKSLSASKIEIGAGPKVNPKERQLSIALNATWSCAFGPITVEEAPIEISLVNFDDKKGSISGPKVSAFNTSASFENEYTKLTVKGVSIQFALSIGFGIEFTPNYVKIGQYVLEKLAIETAEGVIAVDAAALASAAATIALPRAAAAAVGVGL